MKNDKNGKNINKRTQMKRVIKETESRIPKPGDRKLSISSKTSANDRRLSIKSSSSASNHVNNGDPPKKKPEELCSVIDSFLSANGKPPIVQKTGSDISQKSFIAAAQNIIHFIDPTFIFDKFEKEFKEIMELLGYPYQIRTTDLQIIGASNRKGATVYPLFWLVRLLIEDMKYNLPDVEADIEEDLRHRIFFFGFLRKAYERWMQEGDEPLSEIEGEMTSFFRQGDDDQERINQELCHEEERLSSELQALMEKDDNPTILQKSLEDLMNREKKVEEELKNLDKKHQQESQIILELKNNETKLLKSQKDTTKEMNSLINRMNDLHIKPEEIMKRTSEALDIEKNVQGNNEKIHFLDESINQLKKMIQDEKDAIGIMLEDLNNYYSEININKKISLSNNIEEVINEIEELRTLIVKSAPLTGTIEIEAARIENERKNIEKERKSMTKEAETLTTELKNISESKQTNKLSLQKQINDLKAAESKKDMKYLSEKNEAEAKLQEAQGAFERYKDEIKQKLSLLSKESAKLSSLITLQ